ncbi:MAG: tetratricopeptide repeat protein [Blastocatellia bacterium]
MQRQPKTTIKDIEAYLTRQSKEALVALLIEQVKGDDRLYERLMMKAARKSSKKLNLDAFRRAIFNAVAPDDYVHYREMWDYTSGIEDTIHSIKELLKEGFTNEVIELAEYALEEVEEAMNSVDDSAGQMGGILHQLQELHHDACKRAKPDPEELAERLFKWEIESDWETFLGAAETYADALGKKGLAKYRELAEAEWARVPALGAGDKEDYSGKRFRITSLMQSLARQSGDVEALVAVMSRNLSLAYHYLQIAEVYRKAGKDDQALEWAERGVKAFPEQTDSRLRDFLAEEYHRRKRHDEAMQLIWAEFVESQHDYLSAYQKLKRHADRFKKWPQWRERALDLLRERLEQARKNAPKLRWQWGQTDNSELAQIFLWEGDAEAAWQEALEGGCSEDLWVQLAALREKGHPEEALEIYQRQIEPLVNQKNNQAYEQAAKYVGKVRELMKRLRREAEFNAYLESIRKAHKPKRNFMALLDKMK